MAFSLTGKFRRSLSGDGIAIGIASDEARRFGMNAAKRGRLIKARST